jgi:phosphoribosylanthranilate isomerase
MTYVKICGIKSEGDALAASAAGADFIGMVFAQSPRQVTPARAEKIAAALKENRAKAKSVGVFVNTPIPAVRKIAETCRLDWVQLSGDESWEYCLELARPLIKVVKLSRNGSAQEAGAQLDLGHKIMGTRKCLFLLDTAANGKYGGTGTPFDWNKAKSIASQFPLIIAGGLNPDNVGAAIKLLKPWGVDVSSGVETNGAKDMKKIVNFIKAVRDADAGQA